MAGVSGCEGAGDHRQGDGREQRPDAIVPGSYVVQRVTSFFPSAGENLVVCSLRRPRPMKRLDGGRVLAGPKSASDATGRGFIGFPMLNRTSASGGEVDPRSGLLDRVLLPGLLDLVAGLPESFSGTARSPAGLFPGVRLGPKCFRGSADLREPQGDDSKVSRAIDLPEPDQRLGERAPADLRFSGLASGKDRFLSRLPRMERRFTGGVGGESLAHRAGTGGSVLGTIDLPARCALVDLLPTVSAPVPRANQPRPALADHGGVECGTVGTTQACRRVAGGGDGDQAVPRVPPRLLRDPAAMAGRCGGASLPRGAERVDGGRVRGRHLSDLSSQRAPRSSIVSGLVAQRVSPGVLVPSLRPGLGNRR